MKKRKFRPDRTHFAAFCLGIPVVILSSLAIISQNGWIGNTLGVISVVSGAVYFSWDKLGKNEADGESDDVTRIDEFDDIKFEKVSINSEDYICITYRRRFSYQGNNLKENTTKTMVLETALSGLVSADKEGFTHVKIGDKVLADDEIARKSHNSGDGLTQTFKDTISLPPGKTVQIETISMTYYYLRDKLLCHVSEEDTCENYEAKISYPKDMLSMSIKPECRDAKAVKITKDDMMSLDKICFEKALTSHEGFTLRWNKVSD